MKNKEIQYCKNCKNMILHTNKGNFCTLHGICLSDKSISSINKCKNYISNGNIIETEEEVPFEKRGKQMRIRQERFM